MVATAGLISLLSYQNLRNTTDRMSATIQERTIRQVSYDLHAYLEVPQHTRCQVRGGPAYVLDIGQKTCYFYWCLTCIVANESSIAAC
jgi:hypothetical protein